MKRAALIGAGEAGNIVFKNQKEFDFKVQVWLDDDAKKHPKMRTKVKSVGTIKDLPAFVQSVDQIIVAIAGADPKLLARIRAKSGDKQLLIMPSVYQQLEHLFSWEPLRPMNIEDILSRPTRKIDLHATRSYLKGSTVMIAGAAGSIGSELANLICSFGCKRLVLVDIDENRLEEVRIRLEGTTSTEVIARLCDIRSNAHMERLFQFKPDIVFNCAAHKHVPVGEMNPSETIGNNLITTKMLLEMCSKHKVDKIVHISTDKAVTPSSVMGASKTLCESMILRHSPKSPKKYIVRFGNVLNSQGSVLQVWERQLKEGAALTITDPKMERYVMSISEACQLVLKSIELEPGIYLLDMGKRITVQGLFEAFLKLHGKTIGEVRIKKQGIRVGEKLEEELLWPMEKSRRIGKEKILAVNGTPTFEYRRILNSAMEFDDDSVVGELVDQFPLVGQ